MSEEEFERDARETLVNQNELKNNIKEKLKGIYSKVNFDEQIFINSIIVEYNNGCDENRKLKRKIKHLEDLLENEDKRVDELEERIEKAVEWLKDDNKSIDIVDRKSGYDMKRIDIIDLLEILEKKEVKEIKYEKKSTNTNNNR